MSRAQRGALVALLVLAPGMRAAQAAPSRPLSLEEALSLAVPASEGLDFGGGDDTTNGGDFTVPAGVQVTEGAEAEQKTEVFTKIFQAVALAVLLMYLILSMQFGSFIDPLAILLSLPLLLIGVMLALAVTRNSINLMSLIGVILLMGIVAKNAILLIDFAKWARRDGLPLREALIEAGAIRLRPILMTTFALIAGMIPVAVGFGEGSNFRVPLGIAVIGGGGDLHLPHPDRDPHVLRDPRRLADGGGDPAAAAVRGAGRRRGPDAGATDRGVSSQATEAAVRMLPAAR